MHVIEEWEEFVAGRYRADRSVFRAYDEAPDGVKELYRLNHERQTLAFVLAHQEKFRPGRRERISMWETLE